MKWTNEDIEKVEKFIEIKNKGFYVDGGQLTEVYNRVLEKNSPVTNCGSCLRMRVNELEAALNLFKEQAKNSGMTSNELVEEVKAIEEELKEDKSNKRRVVKKKE